MAHIPDQSIEPNKITCPKCQSDQWDCWDERIETWELIETGELYEFPVGYMRCKACDHPYTHMTTDTTGFTLVENDDGY